MANENQKTFWSGQGGSNWVKKKSTLDDMLEPFGDLAIKKLAIEKDSNVIDIGCGSGATTFKIAEKLSQNGSRIFGTPHLANTTLHCFATIEGFMGRPSRLRPV